MQSHHPAPRRAVSAGALLALVLGVGLLLTNAPAAAQSEPEDGRTLVVHTTVAGVITPATTIGAATPVDLEGGAVGDKIVELPSGPRTLVTVGAIVEDDELRGWQ